MNTKEKPQHSELNELREELDKGLDELARLIYRAHTAKTDAQTNIVLLSLIALCLVYLNVWTLDKRKTASRVYSAK